jgi:hypothetical protein
MFAVELLPSRSLKIQETEKEVNKRNRSITKKKFSADSLVEQIEISTAAAAALRGRSPSRQVGQ